MRLQVQLKQMAFQHLLVLTFSQVLVLKLVQGIRPKMVRSMEDEWELEQSEEVERILVKEPRKQLVVAIGLYKQAIEHGQELVVEQQLELVDIQEQQ